MKILSNDPNSLEKAYKNLKRDGKDVEMKKTSVENAMGFDIALDFVINVDLDVAEMIVDMFKYYLEYRLIKHVLLLKTTGDKELVDLEKLKDKEEVGRLGIDDESQLYIEYKMR